MQYKQTVKAFKPIVMSPDQFAAFTKIDIARWTKLAKERKIGLSG